MPSYTLNDLASRLIAAEATDEDHRDIADILDVLASDFTLPDGVRAVIGDALVRWEAVAEDGRTRAASELHPTEALLMVVGDGTQRSALLVDELLGQQQVVQVHDLQLGVVVDKVSEVLAIADGDIEPMPSFGVDVHTEYLLGIAKGDGKVRLLLDIDRVLSTTDVRTVQSVAGPVA